VGRGRTGLRAIGACVALVALVARHRAANANSTPLTVDNMVVGPGHVAIGLDDYGAFGVGLHPSLYDHFRPPGATEGSPSYIGDAFVFVTSLPDNKRTAVALTEDSFGIGLVEMSGDGIVGDRALARTITTPNTQLAPNKVTSAFAITDPMASPSAAVKLSFTLTQELTSTPQLSSLLAQTYTITNTGTVDTALVFEVQWDLDLPWTRPAGSPASDWYLDDVVGVGPGRCYVYQREPSSTAMSVALADGGSDVPISSYFGAKAGVTPDNGPPAYGTARTHQIFDNREMPATWRNHLANVGYDTAGESGAAPADAMIGTEYRFPLAIGQTVTIRVHRHYGTVAVPCAVVGMNCGDGVLNAGETCDSGGVDTAICNGATCTAVACGDGYVNAVAGEACESNGLDSVDCNGTTCVAPTCGDGYLNTAAGEACDSSGVDTDACNGATCSAPACGDGYVNAAAGEECEMDSALCDATSCTYAYRLGGGCAGCSTGEPREALPLGVLVALAVLRRRRAR
jgi:MYXO-CTERM domain-containing protein